MIRYLGKKVMNILEYMTEMRRYLSWAVGLIACKFSQLVVEDKDLRQRGLSQGQG